MPCRPYRLNTFSALNLAFIYSCILFITVIVNLNSPVEIAELHKNNLSCRFFSADIIGGCVNFSTLWFSPPLHGDDLSTQIMELFQAFFGDNTKTSSSRSSRPRNLVQVAGSNRTEPLADLFNGTDLQWFGNISFGTPPQTLTVVFDTGSTTAEVTDVNCKTCQNQKPFFSNSSSTFVSLNQTTVLNFGTGIGVQPSDFENLTVLEGTDTMTILGLSAPQVPLLLILDQTTGFDADPFSGIVGMGFSPNQSVYHVLNVNNVPSIFSLFLTPKAVGDAELTLGGIDESKVNGTLTFAPIILPTPLPRFGALWQLTSSNITVNGHTPSLLSQPLNIIFDSGTSNLVFQPNITQAIYEKISPKIQPHGNLGAFGIPCSEIESIAAVISFTFTDTSGLPFNLTVPREEFNLGPFQDAPEICQTVINALDGFNILGGSLLKHYYSVWDVDHAQLGFVIPSEQLSKGSPMTSPNKDSSTFLSESVYFPLFVGLVTALLLTFSA